MPHPSSRAAGSDRPRQQPTSPGRIPGQDPPRPVAWAHKSPQEVLAMYPPGHHSPEQVLDVLVQLFNTRHTALSRQRAHRARQGPSVDQQQRGYPRRRADRARIGYSPDWLFETERVSGEVVTLMPDWQTPSLPMNLVSPAQRQHSAKVRVFGDFVMAALNKGP